MTKLTQVSSEKCWNGQQNVYSHQSEQTGCEMKFGVYFPPSVHPKSPEKISRKLPVIYFLSGLTCTEQNFIVKSGFQRYAAELDVIVVNPDTSPRNCNVPGEDDAWDFGTGAGFYVDAKVQPFATNYRMQSYVNEELIALVESEFEPFIAAGQRAVTGHSMGGHGALISAFRHPGLYKAVGAFAPIANPSQTPWGVKCLSGYIGSEPSEWNEWDATKLAANYDGPDLHLRIDQVS
jgi:S-formylglutathione hydrolase